MNYDFMTKIDIEKQLLIEQLKFYKRLNEKLDNDEPINIRISKTYAAGSNTSGYTFYESKN